MTFGYGIDATESACKSQRRGTNIRFSRQRASPHGDDRRLQLEEGLATRSRRTPRSVSVVANVPQSYGVRQI